LLAAQNGHTAMVEHLINRYQLDPRTKNKAGKTASMLAQAAGYQELSAYLRRMENGALLPGFSLASSSGASTVSIAAAPQVSLFPPVAIVARNDAAPDEASASLNNALPL
jgi:ankyrin repeat protein